jgi:catechol 2,3-dioxygenase-like lactoylglutathione lyase family enzyme
MGILDHVGIHISDFDKSKAFYGAALAPLGIELVMAFPGAAGFGRGGKPEFWFSLGQDARKVHVAFTAPDRAAVDAFYHAAMAAGGRDNGAPGLRPHYHANYYGAFILDPDGHNLEAVCHRG